MPSLPIPNWLDLIDIALVAGLAWLAIRYLRRTHARAAFAGLGLLGIIYLFARGLELRLAEALFQGFFAVLVLVLVVVFQEDLRRAFEQLGSWRRGRVRLPPQTETLDLLVRAVARLAATRTGALFVLPGREPLDRHLEGGVRLDGRLSEPLVISLFDVSSPGHDGAVVLRGSKIERFAAHLPLSANHAEVGPGGTRHAAALGLAERCDATCIVVSEERGTVSVARQGQLRTLARPEDLVTELRADFAEDPEVRRWWQGHVGLDAALATAIALAMWLVFVPGSDVSEVTVPAKIEVANLPKTLALEAVEPERVDVTLRGPRRALVLAGRGGVTIRLDAYLARMGRRTFSVEAPDVRKPDELSVVTLTPEKVRLSLKDTSPSNGQGPS